MNRADTLSLEVVLEFMVLSPLTVWNMLLKHQPRLEQLGTCRISGSIVALNEIPSEIEKSDKPHFHIQAGDGSIRYSHVRNFSHSLLQIERVVHNLEDAWKWLDPFLPNTARTGEAKNTTR
ncbi:MAG TPA: hypothetical protein PLP42_06360 [Acidobacteriota bacterium]|nr:hypothetical protein [Acidobacteriota bacterium]